MNRRAVLSSSLAVTALLAAGCGGDKSAADNTGMPRQGELDGSTPGSDGNERCTPTRESYDAVRPLFAHWCSTCHDTTPDFGAPFSLLSYESVLGTYDARPIVDHLASALRSGAMPPATQPQPPQSERDALIAFATCSGANMNDGGTAGADGGSAAADGGSHHGGDLMATREPLSADATPPAGATSKDLTANEFAVAKDAKDDYEQFSFTSIAAQDVFIRRFDPVLDESSVVHHLTLRFTGNKQGYLYTWAPGGPSIEFPDGGIRVTPQDTLLLEIHYNNGVGLANVKDSSGVKLWLDAPGGTEYGLANLATWQIFVPAGQRFTASSTCNVQNAAHVFAVAPHMHGIGDSFEHTITRAGGATEDLVSLTGWTFSAQRYYAADVDLAPGDTLHMSCHYYNTRSELVTAGPGTSDEMCFDFMYVTPPNALANCNDNTSL